MDDLATQKYIFAPLNFGLPFLYRFCYAKSFFFLWSQNYRFAKGPSPPAVFDSFPTENTKNDYRAGGSIKGSRKVVRLFGNNTLRDGGPAYDPTPQAPLPCNLFCFVSLRKKTRRGVSGASTLPFPVTKESINQSPP